jgi:hypothetical protein
MLTDFYILGSYRLDRSLLCTISDGIDGLSPCDLIVLEESAEVIPWNSLQRQSSANSSFPFPPYSNCDGVASNYRVSPQNEREIAGLTTWRTHEPIFPCPYDHSFQGKHVAVAYSYNTHKKHAFRDIVCKVPRHIPPNLRLMTRLCPTSHHKTCPI